MADRTDTPDVVDEAELQWQQRPGVVIDDGGNATLVWCRHLGAEYLFKRFHPEHRDVVDTPALRRLVQWRRELPAPRRAALDSVTAWPRRVVRVGDDVGGVLIPPADERLFTVRRDGRRAPRTLSALLSGGSRRAAPVTVRLAVLGHLIVAVRDLHRQGVVVSDLQTENVLYATGRRGTAVYLVDCDSMVSPAHWGRVAPPTAPDTMNEILPDTEPTVGNDLIKLCWLVVRILLDDLSLIGLGDRDRDRLLDQVPAEARSELLTVLRDPADTAAWDSLGAAWCAVTSPGAPEPGIPEPGIPEPGIPEPGIPEPGIPEPGVPEKGVPEKGASGPGVPVAHRRTSWVPAGFAYRPADGPQVLPQRPDRRRRTGNLPVAVVVIGLIALLMVTAVELYTRSG